MQLSGCKFLITALILFIGYNAGMAQESYNRPQDPKPPFPYNNEEVVYTNLQDTSVRLAATFTIPAGKGPFPAILLIGGSGQFPRDEAFYGHKPYHIIADYLARRGIATLRFDDRGAGQSTKGAKPLKELIGADLVSDARAGIDFLLTRKEVDKSQIGVMGGSAGAGQAEVLAVQYPKDIHFIVLLVGSTNMWPGEIVAQQSKTVCRIAGRSAFAQEVDSNFVQRSLYFTRNERDPQLRFRIIDSIAKEELNRIPQPERDSMARSFQSRVKILSSQQFYDAAQRTYEDLLLKVQCPVLAINGDKDVLVDGVYHSPRLAASLKAAGHKDYETHLVKGMNHRLQIAQTGLMEESKDIEHTHAPEVLDILGRWIGKHTRKN